MRGVEGVFSVCFDLFRRGKTPGRRRKNNILKIKKSEDRKKLEKVQIAKIKLRRFHAPLSFSRDPSGWTFHGLKFGREPSVFLAPRRAGKEPKK